MSMLKVPGKTNASVCVDKCTQSIRYSNYFKSHLSRVCRGARSALLVARPFRRVAVKFAAGPPNQI